MKVNPKTVYSRTVGSIIPLCFVGFIGVCVGFASKIDWLIKAGTVVFLSGFALWGFANGGGFIWAFREGIKAEGIRVLWTRPISSGVFVLLMIFLLAAGIFFSSFIVRVLRQ